MVIWREIMQNLVHAIFQFVLSRYKWPRNYRTGKREKFAHHPIKFRSCIGLQDSQSAARHLRHDPGADMPRHVARKRKERPTGRSLPHQISVFWWVH